MIPSHSQIYCTAWGTGSVEDAIVKSIVLATIETIEIKIHENSI
ncbi:hypothetical protein MTBBW1_300077 [Desulfamplus magnetovallimortis]|uniref:Uncharacterized protein n=1 Tax=Desulfamplus magnetovallimortis TaxID=1246637 RepID=A0A1W1HFY3_9BACT|nr:hypothetical protein MTBBW1_300077 [Desulfamplus magnetovallimortis]